MRHRAAAIVRGSSLSSTAMTTNSASSGGPRSRFRRPNIYYGWYIVIATGFVMTVATVPLFHAMTLWR